MLDILYTGREMGFKKLIKLITYFYILYFTDCKSIVNFSGQFSQINHELQDLYSFTAFFEVQLILYFL